MAQIVLSYEGQDSVSDIEREIIAKIKESAYENVNKKLEEERKKVEDKVNNELVYVEKCLQYIGNKMVYKIVKGKYYTENYELADEKTFFEDYNKETDYVWQKGIQFFDLKSKPYDPLFKVNGESYYDMRYIIRNYEETFKDYSKRLNNLREQFNKVAEMADELVKQEPKIKKLIEQYKQIEIDEPFREGLREDW